MSWKFVQLLKSYCFPTDGWTVGCLGTLIHATLISPYLYPRCFRLGLHERTKCVRCNALCDVRCRNRTKPIGPNIRVRACLAIGFFLFLQWTSQSALQRMHFVRSCGPSLTRRLNAHSREPIWCYRVLSCGTITLLLHITLIYANKNWVPLPTLLKNRRKLTFANLLLSYAFLYRFNVTAFLVSHFSITALLHTVTFQNKLIFYGKELLASRSTPKLEGHPLSAVRDILFNIFAATLHIWRPSPPSATCECAVPS
jgi:hypothetical protein